VTLRIYDLEQSRHQGMPHVPANAPGFYYALHRRHELPWPEARTPAAGVMVTTEHAGTHIDALCHQSESLMLHGGVKVDTTIQTSAGFTRLGAETIAPIVRPGILIDVAGFRGTTRLPPRTMISASDLQEVASRQQTPVHEGDVVLVRTGYGSAWDEPSTYYEAAGIGRDGSQWLADAGVHTVGADNGTWDVPGTVDPQMSVTLPGHIILLVRSGVYILEHLNLEELAIDRVYEFEFICLPLKIRGATGSPVRPIALLRAKAGDH